MKFKNNFFKKLKFYEIKHKIYFIFLCDVKETKVSIKTNITAKVKMGFPDSSVKNLPAMQETWALVPGLGRSPGGGKGYPLQ